MVDAPRCAPTTPRSPPVSDSLGLSAATVDTQYTALTTVLGDKNSGLTKLQALLVEAKTAGIDRTKIQADITQIQQPDEGHGQCGNLQRRQLAQRHRDHAATFNLVTSFSRVAGSPPAIGTITVTTANYSLYTAAAGGILDTVSGTASIDTINISALTDSTVDQTTLDGYIAQVTTAIGSVSSAPPTSAPSRTASRPTWTS